MAFRRAAPLTAERVRGAGTDGGRVIAEARRERPGRDPGTGRDTGTVRGDRPPDPGGPVTARARGPARVPPPRPPGAGRGVRHRVSRRGTGSPAPVTR